MTSTGTPGPDPVDTGPDDHPPVEVVVPAGLALDELSRSRLIQALVASPPEVTAVAAPLARLASGASTATQAEWAALDAAERSLGLEPAPGQAITGAVAVRSGVDRGVDERSVTVARGTVLLDPGTCATDPFDPPTAVEPADGRARPPFRRRPVVLFLAGGEPLAEPEALRDLVNGLVAHQVEARLATEQPIDGPHLTRICSPTEATWRRLQPDIAVLGDAEAVERATSWCDQRGTVFIALEPALGSSIELVSWTIGRAQGRLRARIGPRADPAAVARLVNRLCAGPQPAPPVDPPASPVAEPRRGAARSDGRTDDADDPTEAGDRRDRAADRRAERLDEDDAVDDEPEPVLPRGRVQRVAVTAGARTGPRAAARLDQLAGAGFALRVVDLRTDLAEPSERPDADDLGAEVLLIDAAADSGDLSAWLNRAGSATQAVVDLTEGSADPIADDTEPGSAVVALARAAGAVLVGRPDQAEAWRALDVRALVAPVLVTRARAADLRSAASHRLDPPSPLVGWHLAPLDPADTDTDTDTWADPRRAEARVRRAIAEAVGRLLEDQPEARVEIVGVPPADLLDGHPQVVVRSGRPDAGELAAWTVQIWSPGVPDTSGSEVFEAAFAGVPTLTAARAEGADQQLRVAAPEDPSSWLTTLEALADDQVRRRWSGRAATRAEGLRGAEASRTAVERLVGWAAAGVDR